MTTTMNPSIAEPDNNALLDPWRDTQIIKKLMQSKPGGHLIIGLGADWCHKCQALQNAFQTLAKTHPKAAWLWLDLDEHGEFLGRFFPDTLPLLWHYHAGKALRHGSPPPEQEPATAEALLQSVPAASSDLKEANILALLLE